MRTTRRSLLTMLTLGAAAAALAPVVTVEAETVQCHQCVSDSPFPHVYGHPDNAAIVQARADGAPSFFNSGPPVPAREYMDAYEQGRADGYNRGREVEAARQESRQEYVPLAVQARSPEGITDHAFEWDCARQEQGVWRCGNCYHPDHEHAAARLAARGGMTDG